MSKLQNVRASYGRPDVVQMSKKSMLSWREAHLEVKMHKTPGFRPLFDDSIPFRTSARHCGAKHNVSKTERFEPILICRFVDR